MAGGHAWHERQPLHRTVHILPECIITIRNSSWGKVMFLHLSVILFTGGGVFLQPVADTPSPRADTPWQTPPWTDTPP